MIKAPFPQVHETRQGRNGEVLVQPIRIRPLYTADRTNKLWGETEITALLAVASAEIKLALVLALWTGQRQGDLLRLPWSSYDGTHVRFRQSKTGRRVTMPVEAVDQFIDDRRDPYNEMADRIGDAIKQET
jgi:integrase